MCVTQARAGSNVKSAHWREREIGDTGVRTAVTVRYGAWEQSGESGDWSPDSGERRERGAGDRQRRVNGLR